MAQTYTAKGTAAAKSSGTTLTIPNVQIDSGALIIVGLAYDNSQGNPTVKFGKTSLDPIETENLTSYRVRQYFFRRRVGATKDVVATWDSAIAARVMTIAQLTEAGLVDVKSSNTNLSNTVSTTGPNIQVTNPNTIHIHHHMTNGPAGDPIGTAAAGDTLGQRVGTTGDAATTNVTLQESYEIQANAGSPLGNFRGRIINLASRDHAAVGVAWKPTQTYTLTRVFHRTWNADWDQNVMTLVCEDETPGSPGNEAFHVRIPIGVFNNSTDDEVRQYVTEAAQIAGSRTFGGGFPVEEEDDNALARAATFIDETFTV